MELALQLLGDRRPIVCAPLVRNTARTAVHDSCVHVATDHSRTAEGSSRWRHAQGHPAATALH